VQGQATRCDQEYNEGPSNTAKEYAEIDQNFFNIRFENTKEAMTEERPFTVCPDLWLPILFVALVEEWIYMTTHQQDSSQPQQSQDSPHFTTGPGLMMVETVEATEAGMFVLLVLLSFGTGQLVQTEVEVTELTWELSRLRLNGEVDWLYWKEEQRDEEIAVVFVVDDDGI
jgi:hypothetical protein